MDGHPSRLQLERILADAEPARDEAAHEHVARCDVCQSRLERMRAQDAAFLEAYPGASSLARAAHPAAEEQRPRPAAQDREPAGAFSWARLFGWRLGVATGLVAAAAAGLVLWLWPGQTGDHTGPAHGGRSSTANTVRFKGASVVEVAVKRADRSFPWHQERLRAGDVLAFRVLSDRPYLLIFSVEESGRVSFFFTDPSGRRSRLIEPGRRHTLGQGVKLDRYDKAERLFVVLSREPLESQTVRQAVAQRFSQLRGPSLHRLALGDLGLAGEVRSWLITRERKP